MSTEPPPRGRLGLFEILLGQGVVVGAISGAINGGRRYGFWGAVCGLPVGAVLGGLLAAVLMLTFFVTVVSLVLLWTKGIRGLWAFVRGRYEPPNDAPPNPPAPT